MNMTGHLVFIATLVTVICNQNCNCLRTNVAENPVSEVFQPIEYDFGSKETDVRLSSPEETKNINNDVKITEKVYSEQRQNTIDHLVTEIVKYSKKKLPSQFTSKHRIIRQVNAENSHLYPQLTTPSPYVSPYPGNNYPPSNPQWGSNNNYNQTRPGAYGQYFVTPNNTYNNSRPYGPGFGSYPQGQYPSGNISSTGQQTYYPRPSSEGQHFSLITPRPAQNNHYGGPHSGYPSYTHGQYPLSHNFTGYKPGYNNSNSTPYPPYSPISNTQYHAYNNFNRTSPGQSNYPSSGFSHSQGQRPYNISKNSLPGQNNPYGNTYPGFSSHSQGQYPSQQLYPYNGYNNHNNSRPGQHNVHGSSYPGYTSQSDRHNFSRNGYNSPRPNQNNPYGQTYPTYPTPSQNPNPPNNTSPNGQYYPSQNSYSGYPQNPNPVKPNYAGYNTTFGNVHQGQNNWNSVQPSNPNDPYQTRNDADRNNFHYPTNYNNTAYDPRKVPPHNFSY